MRIREYLHELRRPLRAAGRKAQRRRDRRPWVEELESRLVPSCSTSVASNVLTVFCTGGPDTVTVDHGFVPPGGPAAIINGSFAAWDFQYNSIQIDGGSRGLTTNIRANVKPLSLFGAGSTDVVNVGDTSNTVQGIQATLTLENSPQHNTLDIHDDGDSGNHTVTLSSFTPAGDSEFGSITGLAPAAINFEYADTTAVNVKFGTGTRTVNVTGTGVTTNLFNLATATVNIGSSNSVAGIRGTLNLENEPTSDTVNINDAADSAAHRALIETVTRSGDTSLGQLTGIGAAAITWDYFDTAAVNVNFGTGTSEVDVTGTGVTTNLFNLGPTFVFISSIDRDSVAGIQGSLNLENERSHDNVSIYDTLDPADHTALIDTVTRGGDTSLGRLTGIGAAPITWDYSDTSEVGGNFGPGTRTINVTGTGVPTSFGHWGATLNVGNAGNVQGILGTLYLVYAICDVSGSFTLNVDDSADTTGRTVSMMGFQSGQFGGPGGSITGLAPAPITYESCFGDVNAAVNVSGGSGGNVFNIESNSRIANTTVNGGAAAAGDVFHITPTSQYLAGIAGGLTLNGNGGGAETLDFFDSNNPAAETYNFDAVPSILTLTTVPVSINFNGFAGPGQVYLMTNIPGGGGSVVNDPSGMVIVDPPGGPPRLPSGGEPVSVSPAAKRLAVAPAIDAPRPHSQAAVSSLAPDSGHVRATEKPLDPLAVDELFSL
jgi:hypothetical protein